MKNKKAAQPKPKEFVNPAFSSLKGLKTQLTPQTPAKVEPPPPKKAVEADELDLFLQAMSGVARIGHTQGKAAQTKSTTPQPVRAVVRKIDENEQQLFLQAIEGLKLDVRFHEEIPEVPLPVKPAAASRLKQLRRGTIRLDYELDLHGLTRDEALEALETFISGAYRRGQKAVLVITGRGNHSADEPVLKGAVDKWLREEGQEMVVEFFAAPRQMGGDGAVVVFLREQKQSEP